MFMMMTTATGAESVPWCVEKVDCMWSWQQIYSSSGYSCGEWQTTFESSSRT